MCNRSYGKSRKKSRPSGGAVIASVVLFPSLPEPQTAAAVVTAPAPAEDVAAAITQPEKDWVTAIEKKDSATLERLLAVDFVGASPTAHTYNKGSAIDDPKVEPMSSGRWSWMTCR